MLRYFLIPLEQIWHHILEVKQLVITIMCSTKTRTTQNQSRKKRENLNQKEGDVG